MGKAAAIKTELDLRGITAAEALEELDKYLDDALLAGLSTARIIHGKGTGALREAVRRYLEGHPRVSGFRRCRTRRKGVPGSPSWSFDAPWGAPLSCRRTSGGRCWAG